MSTSAITQSTDIAGVIPGSSDANSGLESLLIGDVVSNYDDQISAFNAEIQATTDEKNALTQTKSDLQNVPSTGTGVNDTVGAYHQYTPEQYQNLLAIADTVGMRDTITNGTDSTHSDDFVSNDALDKVQSSIDDKISELNSTSELQMINFQSLMDARKQSLTMLSNMINSDNQTKMAILQNLKN
jgi:hypothetical protein